jgi:hypothetical protein
MSTNLTCSRDGALESDRRATSGTGWCPRFGTRRPRGARSLARCAWLLCFLLPALVPGPNAHAAAPGDYSFRLIARSGPTFDAFGFGAPVLNNEGVVAFTATLRDGTQAIYLSRNGSRTLVASSADFGRFGNLTINDAGQVGFEASLRAVRGEGIFRADGATLTTIAGTRRAGDFDFVNAGPSMNNSGLVAFIGERIVGGDFIDGVYAGDGGPVSAIYDTTGPFADFIGNPSLNDSGAVAFLAVLDTGVSGLFVGSGGAFTTVADDTGAFVSAFAFGAPSLNELGQVAFRAGTNEDPSDNSGATGEGIFLFSDGVVTPILQGGFEDFAALGDPSLNNLGEVAFVVSPTFDQQILVTGPDLVGDRVIGTGDRLLGRTITGLLFSREGLNDRGQLVFVAFFDDGSSAVFLATPTGRP